MEGAHPCNQLTGLSTLGLDRMGEKRLFCGEFLEKSVFSCKYMVDNVGREF
jgi:hypothetical protein